MLQLSATSTAEHKRHSSGYLMSTFSNELTPRFLKFQVAVAVVNGSETRMSKEVGNRTRERYTTTFAHRPLTGRQVLAVNTLSTILRSHPFQSL